MKNAPGIVLREWAQDDQQPVAVLRVALNADAEIIHFNWETVPGQTEGAARCTYKTAVKSVMDYQAQVDRSVLT